MNLILQSCKALTLCILLSSCGVHKATIEVDTKIDTDLYNKKPYEEVQDERQF